MKRQLTLLVVALAMASPLVFVALLNAPVPAGAATDQLPDLRMAHLSNLSVEETSDGRRLLRFDSIIVNVGAGKFQVHGRRATTSDPEMTVYQRIFNDGSTSRYRDLPTNAIMYFAGDGHTHWHVRDLEDYVLSRVDNGVRVGTGAKHGFCFFDNYRFGSTQAPYYRGCANGKPDALQVRTGLSVGWGDRYGSALPDQHIDITGLPSGSYRLRATADLDNWFQESNEANNFTWVVIQLQDSQVSVVRQGPGA